MKIVDLRKTERADRARVAATVVWEDSDRARQDIYFEYRPPVSEEAEPSPDAFLVACVMHAMEFGERRVMVDGTICPELRNGLISATRQACIWYPQFEPPVIEAGAGFRPATPRSPPRVASFLSGGIDALATLRCNRLDYPRDHPASIRDGLFVFGLNTNDFVAGEPVASRTQDFERRLVHMNGLALEAGIHLIPVWTNIRFLARDWPAWNRRGMGAGLSSVAHTVSSRISRALIASAGMRVADRPLGTHPLLDPNYSSSRLEIRQDGRWMTRLEKTAVVAEWDAGLAAIHCCHQHTLQDSFNCGRCHKCVRTMIHLAAVGKLDAAPTFPNHTVTPETIEGVEIPHDEDADFIEQTGPWFIEAGRDGLARAVRNRIARYREHRRRVQGHGWQGTIKRWDGRWTGGVLTRVIRDLRGSRRGRRPDA